MVFELLCIGFSKIGAGNQDIELMSMIYFYFWRFIMCDPKTKKIEFKTLFCIILCMGLILNIGCQSNQQKTHKLQQDNTKDSASQGVVLENNFNNSDLLDSPKQPISTKTGKGFWGHFTETANSLVVIPLAGAAVAIIGLEYEFWRTLGEAF